MTEVIGCSHHNCNSAHKSCVSLVPIFNHLEPEQMDEIMKTVHSASFKKGEIIYHAGNESDSLYIVNKGKIRIYLFPTEDSHFKEWEGRSPMSKWEMNVSRR